MGSLLFLFDNHIGEPLDPPGGLLLETGNGPGTNFLLLESNNTGLALLLEPGNM